MAIMAEAKAALNLFLCIREMDARCPQGHRSALKPTEDHTWDQGFFLFRLHKVQAMLPHCSKAIKTKKPRRDYQKDRRNKNCCDYGPRGSRPQDSTLATGVNTTKIPTQDNCNQGCKRQSRWEDKNLSQTTCYNCNKKSYFAN